MNNEKKQIILNWLKQQEETDSLTQEQRDIFALIRESLHTKKYGLVFEEKEEDIVKETNDSILTLKQKDLIIANNNAKELNYLLEGDNYQALKLLQKTHRNRIDVIYIDPPYNTGNKDFIYNDAYVDSEDTFRHSKWLSFMKKRLELAKTLLTENGVIFISIDDNEYAQLKLLCDDIFNENNFIENFLWNKAAGGSSLSKFVRRDYEYVLAYSNNKNKINGKLMGAITSEMGDSSLINKPNKYSKLFFPKGTIKFVNHSKGSIKPFKDDFFELEDEIVINNNYNSNGVSIWARWKWTQSKLETELNNGTIIISKTELLRLRYIKEKKNEVAIPKKSITISDNVGYTLTATMELKKILDDNSEFSYPKPVSLIVYLLNMVAYDKKESIILDFFAGSGTTGHAVAKLNAEDGGNRTYILCTNNENNICENVTFKRLSNIQDELPHNLIYQQIETINKDEFIVSNYDQRYLDQLEGSSKQLSQLELGKLIDNKEIFFITSQDELENANKDDLLNATVIFMNENKVDPYKSKVYDHIKNKIIIIPDNYYEKELKETDYLW
ncbi:site-specific DNA-methyltransferase [Mycoplasma sp. VS428]|uniref:site-specific DNA-methyltransferase n=1 Tax=Mycoplasma sp. VS428 TaxID=3401684 RepID=UPI003AAF3207